MINRRSFIAALSTSLTAATATAAPLNAESESPALLELSDRLPVALKAYEDAASDVEWIVAEWGPQWPTPNQNAVSFDAASQPDLDILGRQRATTRGAMTFPSRVGTPEGFKEMSDKHKAEALRKSKTKSQRGMGFEQTWAQRYEDGIKPARAYWSEVERIKSASGIEAAKERETQAREALRDLISAIMAFEEQTPMGLAIKAQALTTWQGMPPFWQNVNPQAVLWMAGMTATIERLTA